MAPLRPRPFAERHGHRGQQCWRRLLRREGAQAAELPGAGGALRRQRDRCSIEAESRKRGAGQQRPPLRRDSEQRRCDIEVEASCFLRSNTRCCGRRGLLVVLPCRGAARKRDDAGRRRGLVDEGPRRDTPPGACPERDRQAQNRHLRAAGRLRPHHREGPLALRGSPRRGRLGRRLPSSGLHGDAGRGGRQDPQEALENAPQGRAARLRHVPREPVVSVVAPQPVRREIH
mmetsp:Transcript_127096/g.355952  ORF Transcript_127096/g.355952 Transcript_127096/m.355952 type:complete len:231 (-) Transcript_127096:297-989(-)